MIRSESYARAMVDLAEAHLVGRCGLIRGVREIMALPGDPAVFGAACVHADVAPYLGAGIEGHSGAVGFTWEEAYAAAVGECVERYCCACCWPGSLLRASKNELGGSAVGMDEMQWYSPAQYAHPDFPFPPWRPDAAIHWTPGQSLLTGRRRCIPSSLVYIPYRPDGSADCVGLAVSSGQACGTDVAQATLSGLYEVIERDAFMLRWLRRMAPTRIDCRASPALASVYDRHFGASALAFHLFDFTVDVPIPTLVCIAESRSARGPLMAVGAASGLCEERAAAKALKESYQGLVWARELLVEKPDWRPAENFANVRSFEDHVRLYCEPDMQRHLDFILKTPAVRPARSGMRFDSPADELAAALRIVEDAGLDAVRVDTTSPEIAELGLHCPKIFVPGTVPLTAVHGLPAFGADRLRDVPRRLGFDAPLHRTLNPIPHPFP